MLTYFLSISQNTLNSFCLFLQKAEQNRFRTKISSRWGKKQTQRKKKRRASQEPNILSMTLDAGCSTALLSQIKALQFVPGVCIKETTCKWLHLETFLKRCNRRDYRLNVSSVSASGEQKAAKPAFPAVWCNVSRLSPCCDPLIQFLVLR